MDSNGNPAISLTTDRNIRKLINKLDKPKKLKRLKTNEFDAQKYTFLKTLEFTPPKPPKVLGRVEKMGKFVFNFHDRFIEVDPVIGSFRRYKLKSDYPTNTV